MLTDLYLNERTINGGRDRRRGGSGVKWRGFGGKAREGPPLLLIPHFRAVLAVLAIIACLPLLPFPPPPDTPGERARPPTHLAPTAFRSLANLLYAIREKRGAMGGESKVPHPAGLSPLRGAGVPPPPHLVVLLLKQPPSHPHALAQRSSLPPLAHRGGKRPPGRCGMRRPARPSAPPNRCRPRPRRRRKERMPLFECTVTPFDAPYIMGVHPEV